MSALVPRMPKPAPVKCQAIVEDYVNGTHYNIRRSMTVPKEKQCSRNARMKLGKFCFCNLHTKLAQEGLIDEDGNVLTRSSLADVRKYPHKFPEGVYLWARGLTPEEIK